MEVRRQLLGASSLLPLWALGTEPRLPSLLGESFTLTAISLALLLFLERCFAG